MKVSDQFIFNDEHSATRPITFKGKYRSDRRKLVIKSKLVRVHFNPGRAFPYFCIMKIFAQVAHGLRRGAHETCLFWYFFEPVSCTR